MEGLANNLGHFQLTTLLILLRVITFQGYLMPCTTCLLLLFQSHILLIFPLLSSYLFLKCMLRSYQGLSHFSFLLMAISSAWSSCPQRTVEFTVCFIQVSTNILSSLQRSSLTTFVTPFPNCRFFCIALIYHSILVLLYIVYFTLQCVIFRSTNTLFIAVATEPRIVPDIY